MQITLTVEQVVCVSRWLQMNLSFTKHFPTNSKKGASHMHTCPTVHVDQSQYPGNLHATFEGQKESYSVMIQD